MYKVSSAASTAFGTEVLSKKGSASIAWVQDLGPGSGFGTWLLDQVQGLGQGAVCLEPAPRTRVWDLGIPNPNQSP